MTVFPRTDTEVIGIAENTLRKNVDVYTRKSYQKLVLRLIKFQLYFSSAGLYIYHLCLRNQTGTMMISYVCYMILDDNLQNKIS